MKLIRANINDHEKIWKMQKEALKYLDNHLKNKVIEAEMLVERNMKNSKKKGR